MADPVGAQVPPDSAPAAAAAVTTLVTEPVKDGTPPAAAVTPAETGDKTKGGTADAPVVAPKAPDTYALTIPDESKAYIDPEDRKQFEAMGRAANWSNEDFNEALTEYATQQRAASARFLEVTKADPEYGGEKLLESQRLAKAAIDLVRPEGHPRREGFLRLMNKVGAGNHIEIISFLADYGKRVSEDAPGMTGGGRGKPKDAAALLYDKTPVG